MCYVHTHENIEWNAMKFIMNMSISITDIQYIEIAMYSDINQCTNNYLFYKIRRIIILFSQRAALNFSSNFIMEYEEQKKNFVKLTVVFFRIRTFLSGDLDSFIKCTNISIDLALFMLDTSIYLI